MPNVAVHRDEVASPAANTNTPTSTLRQEPHDTIQMPDDVESGPVVDKRIVDMESLKRSISLD